VQGQAEPIRLARNNAGLRMLQYIRDEAHRFAQHYHHLLRSKAQLEQDVKSGRRPPRAKKKKASPTEQSIEEVGALTTPDEMPHSTHPVLPILKPAIEPPSQPVTPIDPADLD
jgi:hypothetical protein